MHAEAAEANSQLGLDIKVSDETTCTEMIKQLDQKGIDFYKAHTYGHDYKQAKFE